MKAHGLAARRPAGRHSSHESGRMLLAHRSPTISRPLRSAPSYAGVSFIHLLNSSNEKQPDAYIGNTLNAVGFDAVYVQFYNNYCGLTNFDNANDWNVSLRLPSLPSCAHGAIQFGTWDNWVRPCGLGFLHIWPSLIERLRTVHRPRRCPLTPT